VSGDLIRAGLRCPRRACRLGAHDDLDDLARAHDAERTGDLQGRLVDQGGVRDLDAQPRDARLQVEDVGVPAQCREDLLCLAHGVLLV
jgi:hypothetical protein